MYNISYTLFLFFNLFFILLILQENNSQNNPQMVSARFVLIIDSYQVSLPSEFEQGIELPIFDTLTLSSKSIFLNTNTAGAEMECYQSFCRELSVGVTLIVDATASGWPRARLTADALGVPYLRAEASIAPFARAAAAYSLRLNATDAALIFQNDAELEQALSALLGSTPLRITVHNRLNITTAKILRETRPWPDMFILFADSSNMEPLLRAAVGGGLVTQDQQWLLVLLNFPSNTGNRWVDDLPVAVSELRPSLPEMCCPLQGLPVGCECSNSSQVVPNFISRLTYFLGDLVNSGGTDMAEPRKLVCNPSAVTTGDDEASISSRRDRFSQLMAQVLPQHQALRYDAEKRLLGYRAVLDVSVIRAKSAGRTSLASWSPDRGLTVTSGRQVAGPKRFLRVGMIEAEPWSKKDSVTQQWSGYCYEFLLKLSEMMDFEFEIVKPSPAGLGERAPDSGAWNGSINALSKKDIELIVAPMVMTSEREEVIDFVVPYFDQTGISIVIRTPVQTTSLFKFMTVLRPEVWFSVLGALIATGVMIWLLDRLSPYSFRNDPARYPYPCRQFSLKESFWFALTSFTPQGGGEAPKALSARALVAAYWLFVVLMLATFTANLAAFLTVERLQVTVQNLEQLAKQTRIKYTVVKNSNAFSYFSNMKQAEHSLYRQWVTLTLTSDKENKENPEDPTKYRVWNYPINEVYFHIHHQITEVTKPVETAQEGIEKVLASEDASFAFIHDSAWLRYEVSRSCNLTEIGEVFAEQPYALAVYPGHPLTQEFSRAILTLQRDRFFEELTARFWNQSIRSQCANANDGEGISLESIGGVFIATAFGLMLAVFTLMGEIIWHRFITKRKAAKGLPPENKTPPQQVLPPPPIIKKRPSGFMNISPPRKTVTLGESKTFETKNDIPKVSYITVYPKQ